MKEVSVGKRQFAIVDDEDFEWVNHWRWHLNPQGYAVRKVYLNGRGGRSYQIFMHRLIIGTPENMYTDHRNGVVLDNRKSNLRVCTNDQNMKNRKLNKNSTSGYKGVHLHTYLKRWVARIGTGKGKRVYLGIFDTPEEAAKAYNYAAIKWHGEFARLNEIKDSPPDLGISVSEEVSVDEKLS